MSKTGPEMRQEAKERMKKYRAEMTAKGYVSTTVFLSQEHRAELKRLGDEYRLTRAEAAEHIFQVYLQSDNKNVTQTQNINTEQKAETRATIEALEARIKALENQAEKTDKPEPTDKPIQEIQTEIPGPIPDKKVFDRESTLKVMDQGYNDGEKWDAIAAELNDLGLLTARGKHWTEANAQIFYSRNKD